MNACRPMLATAVPSCSRPVPRTVRSGDGSLGVRKCLSRGLVALCAAGCGLLGSVAIAQAAAPVIGEESVVNVAATSATLQAQVNPEGSETTYRFEYDTSEYGSNASHGVSAPSPQASAGAGSGLVTVEAPVQGMSPATLYHFRVVATNSAHETAYGPDQTLTTQREREPQTLPDNRAWELVSPPDRHGALIMAPGALAPVQAAAGGGRIAYGAIGAIEAEPEGNPALEPSMVLSTHGVEGWSSRDIATPNEQATEGFFVGYPNEYKLFSSDLSTALVLPFNHTTPLPPLPPTAEQTLYLRHGNGSFEALVTAANVETGAHFGGRYNGYGGPILAFEDASPDLAHVVFSSRVPLTANATGSGADEKWLYEWSAGRIELVSVLPDGEPDSEWEQALGDENKHNERATVASDGNVFWRQGESHLYMFDAETGRSVQLNAGGGGAFYQDASVEGTRAFFTEGEELYEYDVGSGSHPPTLSDLTVPVNAGESAGVQRLIPGVSEDGEYAYVVAGGVLTTGANAYGETATAGAENLYELHLQGESWQPTFIATLSGSDYPDWGGYGELTGLTSRVSPDGRYLAFMSQLSLTGYDNDDAESGVPDEEVYLYDAQTAKLVCASCNPSGARPTGIDDVERKLLDPERVWEGTWLAASVPGWTPNGIGEALYQSRYLDNAGRLFFDSSDALVPQAANHTEDVYEYESPVGAGGGIESDSCTEGSVTYGGRSGGCINLISSGTAGEESEFLDASESGDDVFFYSAATLTPQAPASGYSVYDAHVCGAGWACPTQSAVQPPPCTTTESCRTGSSAQPTIYGAPSSATFSGVGNLVSPGGRESNQKKIVKKTVKCKRGFVKSKKNKCVRNKSKHKAKKSAHTNRRTK